jgi:hypothetical protein
MPREGWTARASLNSTLGRIARSNVHAMKDVCLRVTLSRESRALPRARAWFASRAFGQRDRRFSKSFSVFPANLEWGAGLSLSGFFGVVNRHGRVLFRDLGRSFLCFFEKERCLSHAGFWPGGYSDFWFYTFIGLWICNVCKMSFLLCFFVPCRTVCSYNGAARVWNFRT